MEVFLSGETDQYFVDVPFARRITKTSQNCAEQWTSEHSGVSS